MWYCLMSVIVIIVIVSVCNIKCKVMTIPSHAVSGSKVTVDKFFFGEVSHSLCNLVANAKNSLSSTCKLKQSSSLKQCTYHCTHVIEEKRKVAHLHRVF